MRTTLVEGTGLVLKKRNSEGKDTKLRVIFLVRCLCLHRCSAVPPSLVVPGSRLPVNSPSCLPLPRRCSMTKQHEYV